MNLNLQIVVYSQKDAEPPIKPFFASLNKMGLRLINKVEQIIKSLVCDGINPRYTEQIAGKGINKIKIDHAKHKIRIHYFCYNRKFVVLLNGFCKKHGYQKGDSRISKLAASLEEKAVMLKNNFEKYPTNYKKFEI